MYLVSVIIDVSLIGIVKNFAIVYEKYVRKTGCFVIVQP